MVGILSKKHKCSEKHCGVKDANRSAVQFVKKLSYAFDFNEEQLFDFRYIGYLLRHTLYNQLFHTLSKHSAKALSAAWKRTKRKVKVWTCVFTAYFQK